MGHDQYGGGAFPYTHDRFDAHAEQLGTLVTKENGKKLAE
jgi:hypothetical protein